MQEKAFTDLFCSKLWVVLKTMKIDNFLEPLGRSTACFVEFFIRIFLPCLCIFHTHWIMHLLAL